MVLKRWMILLLIVTNSIISLKIAPCFRGLSDHAKQSLNTIDTIGTIWHLTDLDGRHLFIFYGVLITGHRSKRWGASDSSLNCLH
ncbi:hypothetical protein AAG906_030624 [Vitis piasezkii]